MSFVNKCTQQVSRTLKNRVGFSIGPPKEVIFRPDLSLQVSVLIIYWHCFQVSFARAQLVENRICRKKDPRLLSEKISGIC